MLADAFRFFRTITPRRGINLLSVQAGMILSFILHKPVLWGLPHTLSVEPGTMCNLACPECPVGNGTLKRENGVMEPDLFRKIIDQTSGHLNHLILYFQGEPFMVPHLFKMIRYAKGKNIYVSTSTNGHFFDRQTISEILGSGLDRLIISLDGASAETYKKYRIGGDFERVVKGIRDLTAHRKEGGYHRPFIIIQFIYFRHNIHEKEKMAGLVKELGADKLEFKTAQFYNLTKTNPLIPEDDRFSRYVFREGHYEMKYSLKNRCPRLWNTGVITRDGKVVPCCYDKNADHVMGQVTELPFRDIWHSVRFNDFRQQVLKRRTEIAMCRNCTEGLGRLKYGRSIIPH